MEIAAHSTCQPGRPWPNRDAQAGSFGRAPSQTSASSGSFLPGRPGSPPRSADNSSISARSSPDTDPNASSLARAKYSSPSRSYRAPRWARRPANRSMTPRASTAPTSRAGGSTRSAAMSAR